MAAGPGGVWKHSSSKRSVGPGLGVPGGSWLSLPGAEGLGGDKWRLNLQKLNRGGFLTAGDAGGWGQAQGEPLGRVGLSGLAVPQTLSLWSRDSGVSEVP